MNKSDSEELCRLTDELLMSEELETIHEIAWAMKEILKRNTESSELFNYAKSLMYQEAERLGCL